MRYLRLQRSHANRRRADRGAEREAERNGPRATPAQSDSDDLAYPAPADPDPGIASRKLKSG